MSDTTTNTEDRRIDDATPDTNVTGTEILPISDSGTAKSVSIAQIKNFVLAQIAALAAASSSDISTDFIYIKQNGEMKPVTASVLADAILAFMVGKTAASTLADADKLPISSSNTAKTTTMSALASYVQGKITIPPIDVHGLSTTAVDGDFSNNDEIALAVNSGGNTWTTKKLTFSMLLDWVSKHPTVAEATSEYSLLVLNNDGAIGSLATVPYGTGNVSGPDSVTNGKIPLWNKPTASDPDRVLKDGVSLVPSSDQDVSTITSTSSNTEVPTSAAVYQHTNIVYRDCVRKPSYAITSGKVPVWYGTNGQLERGYTVNTSISSSSASNDNLATELAIRTAIDNSIEAYSPITSSATAPTEAASGYKPLALVFCTDNNKLYLNAGTASSAHWIVFTGGLS